MFLLKREMMVYLVVFDPASTRLGQNLYPDLEAYIDHNYVCQKQGEEYDSCSFAPEKRRDRTREEFFEGSILASVPVHDERKHVMRHLKNILIF